MAPPLGRRGGQKGVLTPIEEIVKFVEKMTSIGHPMSLAQLRVMAAEIIQECPTPRGRFLQAWSWVRWCPMCHPNLTLRVAHKSKMGMTKGSYMENVQSLYKNLEERYVKHNYPRLILNADVSDAQVGRKGGACVFASRGVRQMHTITPDEHEHHLVQSCINVASKGIPNFYIFMGKQFTQITSITVKPVFAWPCNLRHG